MAIPFGALSSTFGRLPSIHFNVRISPVGATRAMKPLSSLAKGEPLMLLTRYTSACASYSTDSGAARPVISKRGVAMGAGAPGAGDWGGASAPAPNAGAIATNDSNDDNPTVEIRMAPLTC